MKVEMINLPDRQHIVWYLQKQQLNISQTPVVLLNLLFIPHKTNSG